MALIDHKEPIRGRPNFASIRLLEKQLENEAKNIYYAPKPWFGFAVDLVSLDSYCLCSNKLFVAPENPDTTPEFEDNELLIDSAFLLAESNF